jgi:hypothetical protein
MHRRPSRKILRLAVLGIAAAAVLLCLSALGDVGRILGALIALSSARDWSVYWAARDRFESWRKRFRR